MKGSVPIACGFLLLLKNCKEGKKSIKWSLTIIMQKAIKKMLDSFDQYRQQSSHLRMLIFVKFLSQEPCSPFSFYFLLWFNLFTWVVPNLVQCPSFTLIVSLVKKTLVLDKQPRKTLERHLHFIGNTLESPVFHFNYTCHSLVPLSVTHLSLVGHLVSNATTEYFNTDFLGLEAGSYKALTSSLAVSKGFSFRLSHGLLGCASMSCLLCLSGWYWT